MVEFPERHQCQWPEGEPPKLKWCCLPTKPGKPYCPHHCAASYVETEPLNAEAVIDESWQSGQFSD